MSLAPASSRGFFLNARLAVNGIQCAARSFGTLTLGELGLLSSMAGLVGFGWAACQITSFALRRERRDAVIFPRNHAVHTSNSLEIGGRDPEHFALGILGIEPEQRQLRERVFKRRPATADLAQQPAL